MTVAFTELALSRRLQRLLSSTPIASTPSLFQLQQNLERTSSKKDIQIATMTTAAPASAATTTPTKKLDIQMISDNICPFCLLGKKKIEAAIAKLPSNVKVTLDFRPYELDPTLPSPGTNKMQRYYMKFGARVDSMLTQMKANGAPYGINFSYGGNIGNTLNSHRLIEWSKSEKMGSGAHTDKLVNTFFNAYFEREQDISDENTLVTLATQAGLPATADEVRAFLKSDELKKQVKEEIEDARKAGISGVPHFIIDGKYQVSGAQDPETFLSVFKKAGFA